MNLIDTSLMSGRIRVDAALVRETPIVRGLSVFPWVLGNDAAATIHGALAGLTVPEQEMAQLAQIQ